MPTLEFDESERSTFSPIIRYGYSVYGLCMIGGGDGAFAQMNLLNLEDTINVGLFESV